MRSVPFELANPRGDPLRGDLLQPDGTAAPRAVVVVCHGFKGFKNWGFFPELGERLARAGFVCVLFNFSGSGIGPDLLNFSELDRFAADTLSKQLEDLGCVLDALESGTIAARSADLDRIGVLGHSRGAATAILRAREDRRVRAVVAWAGVSTLWRYSERELAEWKERGHMEFLNTRTNQVMRVNYSVVEDLIENRQRFDVLDVVPKLEVPLLIVHGEEDLSVRVQEAHDLHAAAGSSRTEIRIIPRTGHTFGAVHPWQGSTAALDEAIETSIRWLRTHLAPPATGSPSE
ncbi:MAG: alpha/beta hydrolase family protein [Candidatus Krumholzibacteriia bacterium]